MRATVLFEKCCFRVNTKRGNYLFGLINIVSKNKNNLSAKLNSQFNKRKLFQEDVTI